MRVLLLLVMLSSCGGNASALCEAWASATCPSDFPNLQPSVSVDACTSNFDFACRGDDCDAEYEARIRCETDNPNCCNDTECNNAPLTACAAVTQTWNDCVAAARAACE